MDLKVWFLGICTHIFNTSTAPNAPVLRRTVCVNASNGKTVAINGVALQIAPHIPRLIVDVNDVIGPVPDLFPPPANGRHVVELHGVSLAVDNAFGLVTTASNFTEVANLDLLTLDLGPVDPAVVLDQNAEFSSMQFDTSQGVFAAGRTRENAVVGLLTVTTEESPEADGVTLSIMPYGQTPALLKLRSGSEITIVNDAAPGQDQPWDFALHYFCVTPFPHDPHIPDEEDIETLQLITPSYTWPLLTVGPGCSNSTYP